MLNVQAIAAKLTTKTLDLGLAGQLVDGVIELIDLAEDVYDGLKGSEKLEIVKAAAKALAETLGIQDDFDRLWKVLNPLISLLVALFNMKSLWKKATPAS